MFVAISECMSLFNDKGKFQEYIIKFEKIKAGCEI